MNATSRTRSLGTAKRPRRGEPRRVPAQHVLPSTSSKLLHSNWVRSAAVLGAVVALTGMAFGSSTSSSHHPKVHQAAVVIVPVDATGAGAGPQSFATIYLDPSTSVTPTKPASVAVQDSASQQASQLASDGIPSTALAAYQRAATRENATDTACGMSWPLLAAIGRVESDHGRSGGATLYTNGESRPHIIGIALNGVGTALIRDTDHGRLDGDVVYDHAVGPMQIIPTTWQEYAVDGNGDGQRDPFNIDDAAATAARYLCTASSKLGTLAGQTRAIRAYNDSDDYVKLVLATESIYARGVPGLVVPTVSAGALPATQRVHVPPADPGPPLGLNPSLLVAPPAATSTSVTPSAARPAISTSASHSSTTAASPPPPPPPSPSTSSPRSPTPSSSRPSSPTPSSSAHASSSPTATPSNSPSGS